MSLMIGDREGAGGKQDREKEIAHVIHTRLNQKTTTKKFLVQSTYLSKYSICSPSLYNMFFTEGSR